MNYDLLNPYTPVARLHNKVLDNVGKKINIDSSWSEISNALAEATASVFEIDPNPDRYEYSTVLAWANGSLFYPTRFPNTTVLKDNKLYGVLEAYSLLFGLPGNLVGNADEIRDYQKSIVPKLVNLSLDEASLIAVLMANAIFHDSVEYWEIASKGEGPFAPWFEGVQLKPSSVARADAEGAFWGGLGGGIGGAIWGGIAGSVAPGPGTIVGAGSGFVVGLFRGALTGGITASLKEGLSPKKPCPNS